MEAFAGENYYTRNWTEWVVLMNLTTPEWGIGYFPSNLAAIPSDLNSSFTFPDGTLLVTNAGKADFGSTAIEQVIFGVTSGVVLLWAAIWLYFKRSALLVAMLKAIFRRGDEGTAEESRPLSPMSEMTAVNADHKAQGGDFEEFSHALLKFYYDGIETKLELYEKDALHDVIEPGDIEAVTALVRQMYDCDLELWSKQTVRSFSDAKRAEYQKKSDAILAEIRRIIYGWNDRGVMLGWDADEKERLGNVVEILRDRIPASRYSAPAPTTRNQAPPQQYSAQPQQGPRQQAPQGPAPQQQQQYPQYQQYPQQPQQAQAAQQFRQHQYPQQPQAYPQQQQRQQPEQQGTQQHEQQRHFYQQRRQQQQQQQPPPQQAGAGRFWSQQPGRPSGQEQQQPAWIQQGHQ
jgi:hypothetical protein